MNLHLSLDEKFIDFVYEDLKDLNLLSSNEIVICLKEAGEFKYVKEKQLQSAIYGTLEWHKFIEDVKFRYERIFIHYLDPIFYDLILKMPPNIKIIWCFFGHDGFIAYPPYFFFQNKTIDFLETRRRNKIKKKLGVFTNALFPLINFKKNVFFYYKNIKRLKVFRRINYFGHFIYDDYLLIKKKAAADFKYIEFTFNSFETLGRFSLISGGHDILLGNSAGVTNNHLDILEKLENIVSIDSKIICPLSYGGDKEYIRSVENMGNRLFKDHFVPLKTFLSFNEYSEIINNCGFVIMNQDRSQASDNLLISFSQGAKVFMSNKSSLFRFFKSLSINVFSIQDDLTAKNLETPLSLEMILHNCRMLTEYFGKESHIERLKAILNI